jgi:hypothetical protein
MGVIGRMLLHGELWHVDGQTLYKVFYLSGTIVICVVTYLLMSFLLKNEEVSFVMDMLKRKFSI